MVRQSANATDDRVEDIADLEAGDTVTLVSGDHTRGTYTVGDVFESSWSGSTSAELIDDDETGHDRYVRIADLSNGGIRIKGGDVVRVYRD